MAGTAKRSMRSRTEPASSIQGPATKYTDEKLEKMADEMLAFIKGDKSVLFVRAFFTKIGIYFPCVYDWKHLNKKFESTFTLCQQICADRVQHGVLTGKLDGRYATRFMHFFDRDLDKKDLEHKKKELEQTIEITKNAEIENTGFKVILEVEKK